MLSFKNIYNLVVNIRSYFKSNWSNMKICRFVIKLNKELKIGLYKYICI